MKEYFENYYGKEKEDSAGKPREEPRNLLSVAYKNVVGTRRSSWRVLKSLSNTENPNQDVLDEYIDIIVKELDSICMEVIVSCCNYCKENSSLYTLLIGFTG